VDTHGEPMGTQGGQPMKYSTGFQEPLCAKRRPKNAIVWSSGVSNRW